MANWNSGYRFNTLPQEQGFAWNSAKYIYYVNVSEVIRCTDNILPVLAKLILSDNSIQALDTIAQTALYQTSDTFASVDSPAISTLYKVLESVNISDEFSDLVVSAFLKENLGLVEEAKQLAEILSSDIVNLEDITEQSALFDLLEKFNLNELSCYIEALIKTHDPFDISDSTKKAVSDFMIGVHSGLDNAYDWFLPFEMMVDRGETIIQVMPEAELTTVEMPGADGSIIEDTVYKDRMFQIVSYSHQGLTIAEKEELKARIARVLDTTKHQTKKLTIQNRGITFDVKYDGSANILEGPSYVKASVPFRVSPYGYGMFEGELEGKGLIFNDGDIAVGVVNIITGPISNPSFTIGATAYQYNGEVLEGQQLIIDHSMMTCYTQDKSGKKLQNELANLTGEFIRIPAKTGVVLDAPDETATHLRTVWKPKVLW